MMGSPKIAVIGAGANGAGIAADMVRAGHDVTLFEQWPDNVAAIRSDGVVTQEPDRTLVADVPVRHLCEVAELRGERFDLLYVVVKAYDTRWACELMRPYLADGGLAVGLQNGMSVDDMAEILGQERTLGAVIEIAAGMFTPGVVERHTPASGTWFGVGSLSAATRGREEEIAAPLGAAGTAQVVDDIRSAKWMKLVVNAAELVPSAILDLPLLQAAQVPGMHDFMLATGKEAVRTAVDLGRRIVPIFGLPDADPDDPEGFVTTMLDMVYTHWSLPHTKTTVLQDWQKGRRSEVDQLNGLVVAERRRLGGSAPRNARVVEIAHRIERGELGGGLHAVDMLLAPL